MDEMTARTLSRMTADFYERVAPSFSATRRRAWPGWERVLEEAGILRGRWGADRPLRVLDLACGNLRFERFLAERTRGEARASGGMCTPDVRVLAVDSCDVLAASPAPGAHVSYRHVDIAETLLVEGGLQRHLPSRGHDLAVCFAFLHHLPLPEQRSRALASLAGSTRPGGYVAASLWQLSHSERLLERARATTAEALSRLGDVGLGPRDYLLGWQDRTDALRFCHDFSECEVDELAASVAPSAREVARFSADGATGDLNRYLILQVAG